MPAVGSDSCKACSRRGKASVAFGGSIIPLGTSGHFGHWTTAGTTGELAQEARYTLTRAALSGSSIDRDLLKAFLQFQFVRV